MVVSANHLLQRVSEYEQEEHVSEEMGRAGVEEECSEQGPDFSIPKQVVPAEHEVRVDEAGVLLPSPKAQPYASQYEQIVHSHGGPPLKRSDSQRTISEVPNYRPRASRHSSFFSKGRLRQ